MIGPVSARPALLGLLGALALNRVEARPARSTRQRAALAVVRALGGREGENGAQTFFIYLKLQFRTFGVSLRRILVIVLSLLRQNAWGHDDGRPRYWHSHWIFGRRLLAGGRPRCELYDILDGVMRLVWRK